ncbi:MAG: alpha/beta fold hydrolase [Streptosporangiaceae bacterium]
MELQRLTLGPLPVLSSGKGQPLFYLGGLLPIAGVDASLARRSAEFSARPFAEMRTVIYANRSPGMPQGMTIAEIAAEHAAAIKALDSGPVDVIGVSTGGSIAQQLAADHPEAVRRLVLISTGCRLSAKTRRMQARIAQYVRAGNPQRALASLAVGIVLPNAELLAHAVAPMMSAPARRLGDMTDLATTIEAEDQFDLARCGSPIAAPTLILAGARDRFYPQTLLQETQRTIPGSHMQLFPRRGHLTTMTHPRLISAARDHLDER